MAFRGKSYQRIDKIHEAQADEYATAEALQEAAELATAAIAAAVQIPSMGNREIVELMREYLGGLVENSLLKAVLASWVGRLSGAPGPPRAVDILVPDPARLRQAAVEQLKSQLDA